MTIGVQSPELITRIAELREKCNNGTITLDEMKEGVKFMRQDRFKSLEAQPKASKSKTPSRPVADLLAELLGPST